MITARFSNLFSRPLDGLRFGLGPNPAINRWAIFNRPLTRTRRRYSFCIPAQLWLARTSRENTVLLLPPRVTDKDVWALITHNPPAFRTRDAFDSSEVNIYRYYLHDRECAANLRLIGTEIVSRKPRSCVNLRKFDPSEQIRFRPNGHAQLGCDNAKGAAGSRGDENSSAVIDDNTLIPGCGDDRHILVAFICSGRSQQTGH
jgi:hypothetical protein